MTLKEVRQLCLSMSAILHNEGKAAANEGNNEVACKFFAKRDWWINKLNHLPPDETNKCTTEKKSQNHESL